MTNSNFIDLKQFDKNQLEEILLLAEQIKSGDLNVENFFERKTLGLLFSVASTRTRLSFQSGIRQMGGHAEYLNSDHLQLVNHESLVDTAKVMSKYLDGLIVRMYDMKNYGKGREALNTLASHASIPIINALDDKDHPCQVMADILTLKERFGEDYKKKKLVFSWGYAKRQKSPGVPHSMLVAGSLLGMNMEFVHPKGFDLDPEYTSFAQQQISESGGQLTFSNDLDDATRDADVVYVKSWKALTLSSEEDMAIRNEMKDKWRIGEHHFANANPDALFMNCLPIIRGEQADADVIDGKRSIIYQEAENRLHVQKAILHTVFENVRQPEHSLVN